MQENKHRIIKQHFIYYTDIGGVNLLIFDADYTRLNGNNGYKNCLAMIESLKNHEKNPIEFEHFLWPDNTNDGFFEDLLDKLIPKHKVEIVDCIKSHITCLGYVEKNHDITVPGIKEKINFYVHLHNHPSKLVERSYKNEIWSIDTNICLELASLKTFLTKYLPTSREL